MSPADKLFFADVYELEYIETSGGDVYAIALVAPDGEIIEIQDVDSGLALVEWPIAECRALWQRREMRRAEAA